MLWHEQLVQGELFPHLCSSCKMEIPKGDEITQTIYFPPPGRKVVYNFCSNHCHTEFARKKIGASYG